MTLTRPWTLLTRDGAADQDSSLVARAREGRGTAFDALRRRYDPAMRGFVVRRVGPDAADDLVQDIWLACWTALPQYNGRARFKAWLYGIAAHKCTDHFRARAQQARRDEAAFEAGRYQPDAYAAADLRRTVKGALALLPDAQREVVELYYYGELTLAEIAQALGRNLNTVKYQFYRAHAQVAQELRHESTQT